jgi:hypothetical protein
MRYLTVVLASLLLAPLITAHAQVSLSLSFNVSTQPAWGPTGYDYVEYYYLPDIEVYYDVSQHRYYYYQEGRWASGRSLPVRYRSYNVYASYKVVINEREPWRNHPSNKSTYASYKGRHDQKVIRDSKDSKYFVNKNHPEHSNWQKKQKGHSGKKKGR